MRTKMNVVIPWLLALAVMWALPCRASAAALGKVLRVVGSVEIKRAARTRPLQARDEFQAGDVLRVLPKSGVTLVYYADGARYALTAQSSCRTEPGRPRTLTGPAPRALSPLAVALVRAAGQTNARFAGTVIRGGEEVEGAPRHLCPIGAVRDRAVIVHWEDPVTGQAAQDRQWEVRLQLGDGAKTLWRRTLAAGVTECALPPELLLPGTRYAWTVYAVGGEHNGASSQAFLYMLTPDERAQVQRLEQNAAHPQRAEPSDLDEDRLLAEVYERMALYRDALHIWTAAAKAFPDDQDVQRSITRLREKLQMWGGE
jgi:hypothetical protein